MTNTEREEVMATLSKIEADLAEVKVQLLRGGGLRGTD
jgi:hypothetical protein